MVPQNFAVLDDDPDAPAQVVRHFGGPGRVGRDAGSLGSRKECAVYGFDRGGSMFGGGLMMLLLWWLVPIAMAIAPASYLARRPGTGGSERTALDILKERYAHNAQSARPLGNDQ